jgi:hypothetical protein
MKGSLIVHRLVQKFLRGNGEYPLNRELALSQSRYGHSGHSDGEEKTSMLLPGIDPPPPVQPTINHFLTSVKTQATASLLKISDGWQWNGVERINGLDKN